MTKIHNWEEIEEVHCRYGMLPDLTSSRARIYKHLVKDWDARASEALIFTEADPNGIDPLLRIRTMINRGHLDQAVEYIKQLNTNHTLQASEFIEVLLETTRLEGFKGNWVECLSMSNRALTLQCSPVTRVTLLQIRSRASFEVGDYLASLQDIDAIKSLLKIFPYSNAGWYALIQEVKVLAHTKQISDAMDLLAKVWRNLLAGEALTIDFILALIRTEADVKRTGGLPHKEYAYAGYLIAESMGDKLYAGLGLLEMYYATRCELSRSRINKKLTPYVAEYELIKKARMAIEGNNENKTAYSQSFRAFKEAHLTTVESLSEYPYEKILLLKEGFLLQIKNLTFNKITLADQLKKALVAISNGPISKIDFFKIVWGEQKYVTVIHDELIRSLLSRLRKSISIKIESKNGIISTTNTLILS